MLTLVVILTLGCTGESNEGCTNFDASNFDASATTDDGSCIVKRVFITSSVYEGVLTQYNAESVGLAAGDALCQTAATAANLGGTWKAWLSDTNDGAIERLVDVGAYYLVDGLTKVFNNYANLGTTPLVPINMDENAATVGGSVYVWTSTGTGGQPATCFVNNYGVPEDACGQWNDPNGRATNGLVTAGSTSNWTDNGCDNLCSGCNYFCTDLLRLYCFEQ